MNHIREEYQQWLKSLVGAEQYSELLAYLGDTEFIFTIARDSNRAEDGIDLRYRFAFDHGYTNNDISEAFGNERCSVLEMMVALCLRIDGEIMDNMDGTDHTYTWFISMLESLGLSDMRDGRFDIHKAERIINRFLYRNYEPNGRGGLFTFYDSRDDVRDAEIWAQMMRYLTEFIFERGIA